MRQLLFVEAGTSAMNGTIICPCHGSRFSATAGSVQSSAATTPLPAKTVTVTGDTLTVS